MGNHDYGYCYSEVVEAMQKNHVRLMEHKSYKLMKDGQHNYSKRCTQSV